ncbi:Hypothetical predicted protein [Pelobates cultripes]|uniref:Uncharacterized protein n=1 Tax=Pelobates cultripes TaxID=61616 RepID=A0AAD1VMV2_PELCU|nr:Hypothetical predicted protein [Pelobates cultripes]
MQTRNRYHQICGFVTATYADDVLLTLTNPASFIPKIVTLIDPYAELSRYKINLSRSYCRSHTNPNRYRTY